MTFVKDLCLGGLSDMISLEPMTGMYQSNRVSFLGSPAKQGLNRLYFVRMKNHPYEHTKSHPFSHIQQVYESCKEKEFKARGAPQGAKLAPPEGWRFKVYSLPLCIFLWDRIWKCKITLTQPLQ